MVDAPDLVLGGPKLVAARKRVELTQRGLSQRARVTLNTIEAYEQGREKNPSLRILGRLMRVLRCELEDLVE